MEELFQRITQAGIRSEFLSLPNYKATVDFAQRRHLYYLKYCALIKSYYLDF